MPPQSKAPPPAPPADTPEEAEAKKEEAYRRAQVEYHTQMVARLQECYETLRDNQKDNPADEVPELAAHYQVLGLEPGSTRLAVKKAYRNLSL